ncbi:MAG: hypothetical protein WA173_05185 [Pseudomonas sp.]|nr:hypothetical protein [Pseudomonas sp.]
MQEHPYSLLTVADVHGQALRPRAIQHPAHINYINQFDLTKS